MIIYKSLNKSLQIIRSIKINLNFKNHKNDNFVMMLIFQNKCGRPGGGGLKIRTHADCGQGRRGVKMGKNLRTSLMDGP